VVDFFGLETDFFFEGVAAVDDLLFFFFFLLEDDFLAGSTAPPRAPNPELIENARRLLPATTPNVPEVDATTAAGIVAARQQAAVTAIPFIFLSFLFALEGTVMFSLLFLLFRLLFLRGEGLNDTSSEISTRPGSNDAKK